MSRMTTPEVMLSGQTLPSTRSRVRGAIVEYMSVLQGFSVWAADTVLPVCCPK